jgi:hypothetical protein
MRYLMLCTALALCSCEPEGKDRPLYYKSDLQRLEAIYEQNARLEARLKALDEQSLEVYKLVVELYTYARLSSSTCLSSKSP